MAVLAAVERPVSDDGASIAVRAAAVVSSIIDDGGGGGPAWSRRRWGVPAALPEDA
jgi:hypothetical protein